jgi:Fe-S cluster assembly scaffold protein SufB
MTKEQYNFNAFKALAAQALAHKAVPTKKHEEWKYSDLTLLREDGLPRCARNDESLVCPPHRHCEERSDAAIHLTLDATNYYIVVANGVLDRESSSLPAKGVVLRTADLSTTNLQHGFDSKYQVLQNYSQMTFSLVVEVTTTLDKPLKIYYYNSHNQVTIIKISDGAQVTIHEEMDCLEPSLINHVTKLELGENVKCKHFKHHNFANDVRFLYSSKVSCKAGAQYRNYALNFGCQSYRQDSEAELLGPSASCSFYGVNIGKGQQSYDVVLNVKHKSPQTNSSQHYNQVLADRAKGSFYSKVEIPKGLHAVTARQLNKNLLLNEEAQAFSRPELDIHSDDVACSHGATIGHIDADALAYLKSRGLDQVAAEKLILQGFLVSVFADKGLDEEEHKALTHQVMEHVR